MRLHRCFGALGLVFAMGATSAHAQGQSEALAAAYSTNPQLNAARSNLRAIDENIGIARSGNRPNLTAAFNQELNVSRVVGGGPLNRTASENPTVFSLTLTQPLFQGFRVRNNIRQAEAAVRARRADLVNTEQDILFNTAIAFEDVLQNREIVRLRRDNVRFLGEQVRAAQERFEVGEGTRTDVSQAEARQASSQSALSLSQATLEASEATFFQLTGLEARNLRDDFSEERLLPPSLDASVEIGQRAHPAIIASLHDVDVAIFNVKVAEGQLLPSVNLVGDAATTYNQNQNQNETNSASIRLNVNIPIYQGGNITAQVRQAKEQLGTSRINVDVNRDIVRQNTVASWAQYTATVRSIQAARTGVFSAQLALQGVIEEQRVGQRTTLDVLDAQNDLINAQLTLVAAERDKDVAAFALLSSVGRLTARGLGLRVNLYEPEEHTNAVRDKWYGLRTPDGR